MCQVTGASCGRCLVQTHEFYFETMIPHPFYRVISVIWLALNVRKSMFGLEVENIIKCYSMEPLAVKRRV